MAGMATWLGFHSKTVIGVMAAVCKSLFHVIFITVARIHCSQHQEDTVSSETAREFWQIIPVFTIAIAH